MIRSKSLRLRFIDSVDGGEGGATVVEPVVDAPASGEGQQPEAEGNPAWNVFREKLDPITFRNIQDDLKAMDQSANQRITSLNEQYKPWKQFADAGQTPESIQQAVNIAQSLNEKPEEIYAALGAFLEREGRLPSKQELSQEVDDQKPVGQQQEDDPRFQQLAQQNQQMMQFLQGQQQQQITQRAEQAIDAEIKSLRTAHPELTDDDEKEVVRRAALIAQANFAKGIQKAPTLEEAHADYAALRTRILTTPRAGDSAPQLLPPSGGVPASGNQRTLGQLSRDETQNLVADLIEKNRG